MRRTTKRYKHTHRSRFLGAHTSTTLNRLRVLLRTHTRVSPCACTYIVQVRKSRDNSLKDTIHSPRVPQRSRNDSKRRGDLAQARTTCPLACCCRGMFPLFFFPFAALPFGWTSRSKQPRCRTFPSRRIFSHVRSPPTRIPLYVSVAKVHHHECTWFS